MLSVCKLVVFGFALSLGPIARACDVYMRTESGLVCGARYWAENGIVYASFRGVPYARQPLGPLRFKELQPLEPWAGVYSAIREGPVCPQKDVHFGPLMQPQGTSEACIHANVYVPEDNLPEVTDTPTTGLPIIVLIHGGNFQSGSGDSDIYGPEYLVSKNSDDGNILITFNYRLNVFGFLSLNTPEVPGNQGIRDCVTLLQWVQRNALFFGGNPNDVTLIGQNSGATIAHLLSLSPAADGLFHRLWLMSGSAVPNYSPSPKYAQYVAEKLTSALGITTSDPSEIHRQLVSMPLDKIMKAYYPIQDETAFQTFGPVIETNFPGVTRILDGDPGKLVRSGRGKNYPIMIGFNTAEFYSLQRNIVKTGVLDKIEQNPTLLLNANLTFSLPNDKIVRLGNKIKQKYFSNGVSLDKYLNYLSDFYVVYPAIKLAQWMTDQGATLVFLYQFSYEAQHSAIKEGLGMQYSGTGHFEDMSFIFRINSVVGDHRSLPPTNKDDAMKAWMLKFVSNFVRCSHPSCDARFFEYEAWPPVNDNPLLYEDLKRPKGYKLVQPTPEQQDMLQFFDGILDEI